MCRIGSGMDAELHSSLAIVEFYGLDKADLIFQQDNDPKHISQNASKWFKQNNINILKWHAQSPYLNPIEICGNTLSGSLMNMMSLLLVCMSFGTRCRWNGGEYQRRFVERACPEG